MVKNILQKKNNSITLPSSMTGCSLKECFVQLEKLDKPMNACNETEDLKMTVAAKSDCSEFKFSIGNFPAEIGHNVETDVLNTGKKRKQEESNASANEYEQLALKRRREHLTFLSTLGFDKIKGEAKAFIDELKPTPKKRIDSKLKLKPEPLRRSARLQNVEPSPPKPYNDVLSLRLERLEKPEKPPGPLLFKDVTLQEDNTLTGILVKSFHDVAAEKPERPRSTDFKWYEDNFPHMKTDASLIEKVVLSRIVALCVHPSRLKTLVAAGSKNGQIAFWDVGNKNCDGIFLYEPHSMKVSSLAFNPSNVSEIISSSFDGTVRCGNLEAAVFEEVYRSHTGGFCSSFDFISPSSLVVSEKYGRVRIVDRRRTRQQKEEFNIQSNYIKSVSVHPVKTHYFIASCSSGVVSLWDLRNVKKVPVSMIEHRKSVNSAYFSPVSGKYILTTSMDHKLSVFDSSHLGENMKLKMSIGHNNYTGRWLTPFRAVWLPNSEDGFVVGSMSYPRCIEVFKVTGDLAYKFEGEDLGSICCINAFHPSKPILAGGNSSGKVYMFMNKS